MPGVALAKKHGLHKVGVLVHVTDTQTHTKATLKGTKPSQVVKEHQAPDSPVEEHTKCSSGRMKLRVIIGPLVLDDFCPPHVCLSHM